MNNGDQPEPVVLAMLKAPRPGLVKTRLAADLGAATATAIYRQLAERQMKEIPARWKIEVHYTPADALAEMRDWLGSRPEYFPQAGEDLGARLVKATSGAFSRHAERVLVIGGDCPGLDSATLHAAASALDCADVVLGPAEDGGYYLIGLKQARPALFAQIAWSSDTVFTDTLDRIRDAGLTRALLPQKNDVDDLASWRRAEASRTDAQPSGHRRPTE